MTNCQFCFVFHKTYFSESSFRFTEKQGRSTEIPLFSASHACIASSIFNISPESGTSVILESLLLTHHSNSKTIVYIMVYCWCYIFYGFGKSIMIYIYIYIPYLYHTEYFHYPKYLVCFTCLSQSHLTHNWQPLISLLSLQFHVFPGCHIFVCVLVAQLYLTLCNPVDCSPAYSYVHWIFQATVLEWVAITFSTKFSQFRDRTQVSCIAGRLFTVRYQRGLLHAQNYTISIIFFHLVKFI